MGQKGYTEHTTVYKSEPNGRTLTIVRSRKSMASPGGSSGYPEPFDVKEIADGQITLQYPEFIIGEIIHYGDEEAYSTSLAAGIIYAKLDTTDWSIVEVSSTAADQYATLDTGDGQYTYKPLYLVETVEGDLTITRDYRNAALPRWA